MADTSTNPKSVTFDVEKKLRILLPPLFDLLGDKNLSQRKWNKINKKLKTHVDQRRKDFLANGNYLRIETNLYDIIIEAVLKENKSAEIMFGFIYYVFANLNEVLSPQQRELVRKTIYDLLTQFNKDYRNHLAELAVLSKLIGKGYKLVGIEKDRIWGNKTADFTLERNGEQTLVEVVSIHFDKGKERVVDFIKGKIIDKLDDKTNHGDIHSPFVLVPMLWAFPNELFEYHKLYKNGKIGLPPNVAEPLGYKQFLDDDNDIGFSFKAISQLFTTDNIEIVDP
jgi:hypothetical protein